MKVRSIATAIALTITVSVGASANGSPVGAANARPAQTTISQVASVSMTNAARYAKSHGVKTGIAVLDTKTNTLYYGGYSRTKFPSASVVKVYMAIFLNVTDRMHGRNEREAWPMIVKSSNSAFEYLLGKYFGGSATKLFNWMKSHYAYPRMGAPTPVKSCWGSTRITARGIVQLYAKVLQDDRVRPWLLNAMGHYKSNADGFNQAFGIPSATRHPAIKQGWSNACSPIRPYNTEMNSTGFVRNKRFTVAILTAGKNGIESQRKIINTIAKKVLKSLPE